MARQYHLISAFSCLRGASAGGDSLTPSKSNPSGLQPCRRLWWSRPIWLLLVLLTAGTSCISRGHKASTPDIAARDFTFFLFSDLHLGAENLKAKPAFTREETLAQVKTNLNSMRARVGRPYPERPEFQGLELGAMARPRGLIILGDLTDGHKEPARQQEQWKTFDGLFPARGVLFGAHPVPVFACAGNHDGDPAGPQRQGLVARNRGLSHAGQFAAISSNGVHFALNWDGVHLICLNLCPADATDAQTPFKYGKPGPKSWNDPQGALSFLKDYLARKVGRSGEPVVLMHHYGFDGFSMNDWNWWTPRQRRALYDLLQDYNVAAIFHGHDHHADHYQWPEPKRHGEDLARMFPEGRPAVLRQYDVVSCGNVCWVMRVQGDRLIAAHLHGSGWDMDHGGFFEKSLSPQERSASRE